jgi:hypothetical protein
MGGNVWGKIEGIQRKLQDFALRLLAHQKSHCIRLPNAFGESRHASFEMRPNSITVGDSRRWNMVTTSLTIRGFLLLQLLHAAVWRTALGPMSRRVSTCLRPLPHGTHVVPQIKKNPFTHRVLTVSVLTIQSLLRSASLTLASFGVGTSTCSKRRNRSRLALEV